jgi:hypothetical protein
MTDTHISAHETGRAGRPLSPAKRRSRLRMFYINQIGIENIDPVLSEQVLAAVELTCMAAEQRAKITKHGAASADDLLAVVRLENAAARAVARLGLPAPRGSGPAQIDTIDTHVDSAA